MDKYCINEECRKTVAACSNYQKVINDLNSKVLHQKKTLDDYRHLNMTSFDEINQLESDIRDKEDFINKIKKERSDLKKNVKFLNDKIEMKNKDIMKIQLEFEDYVKTAKDSNRTFEEENEYLRKELVEIQNNWKIKINEEERKEKRMLDEVKSLVAEIDDLKRVNEKKEIQGR